MGDQGWSCNRPAVSHRELGSCKNPARFRFKGQIFLSGVGFSLASWATRSLGVQSSCRIASDRRK